MAEEADVIAAYVVETPVLDNRGVRVGTLRHWVATRERAVEQAEAAPGRTWREVPLEELPEAVRLNLERTRQG